MRGGAREEKWQVKGADHEANAVHRASTRTFIGKASVKGAVWIPLPRVAASSRLQEWLRSLLVSLSVAMFIEDHVVLPSACAMRWESPVH